MEVNPLSAMALGNGGRMLALCVLASLFLSLPLVDGNKHLDGEIEAKVQALRAEGTNKRQREDALKELWNIRQRDDSEGNSLLDAELGHAFEWGLGTARDLESAAERYKRAAKEGSPFAHGRLGLMYALGLGVQRDESRSIVHQYFAASSGADEGGWAIALGYRHLQGHNVPESCHSGVLYYQGPAREVVEEAAVPGSRAVAEKARIAVDRPTGRQPRARQKDVVQYYENSAQLGSSEAQTALGKLYLSGARGVEQDIQRARDLLSRAAKKGDAEAMGQFGWMVANGVGGPKDNSSSSDLLSKSAEKGNPSGQYGLGSLHLLGFGVRKDSSRAAKLLQAAAEQGHPAAQSQLGVLHLLGEGVRRDRARAVHYLALASGQGDPAASYHLAGLHLASSGLRCTHSANLLKSLAERGRYARLAEKAYSLYLSGELDDALLLYLELAEMGMEFAQSNAAAILERYLPAPSSSSSLIPDSLARRSLVVRLHRRAADQDNLVSLLKVGDALFEGSGTEQDKERAASVYRQASTMRSAQAMFNLGRMHELGDGLPRDLHLAKRYFDMARNTNPNAAMPTAIALARVYAKAIVSGQMSRLGAPSEESPTQRSPLLWPSVSAAVALAVFCLGAAFCRFLGRR